MKNLLYFLILVLLLSCTKDDDDMYINIKGKIINQVTNEGIENAPIYVFSKEPYDSFGGGHLDIDNNRGFTDNNGNFSLSLKYSNYENVFSFYSGDEFNFTGLLDGSSQTSKLSFETVRNGELIFKVRRIGKLKIVLNNTNPFDENDRITFSIIHQGSNLTRIYQIDNYGIGNYPPRTMNTQWFGMNVNSIIFSTLQEGYTYKLSVRILKNGIETNYFTPEFETDINNLNEYVLDY